MKSKDYCIFKNTGSSSTHPLIICAKHLHTRDVQILKFLSLRQSADFD